MSNRWRPNADAGAVRMHRNPNTRRRYRKDGEIPERVQQDDRRVVKAALHIYAAELACGDLTISFPRVRRGWDRGDKFEVTPRDYVLA